MSAHTERLVIDGQSLSYEKLVLYIENTNIQVSLSKEARERVRHFRSAVDKWLIEERKAIYGVTTGLGKLKDFVVEGHNQNEFQQKILRSHAVGLGVDFPEPIVRLAMLLRVNVFARGNSGVRVEFVERIIQFLNHGVYPCVPQIGSLGVGDLQAMAHIGLSLIGDSNGRARFRGEEGKSDEVLRKAKVSPVQFDLAAKEALALIDGSTMVLSAAIYSYYKVQQICKVADMATALNMEASRSEVSSLDPRIHEVNNLQAGGETAQILLKLLEGSKWTTEIGRKRLGETTPRVQDAVSIRSTAQVHGAIKDVLHYVQSILEREMNSSKDNPLIFTNGINFESLSGGNYHGAHLSYAMDFMGIVTTDLAVISERRSARLLDPFMSYGLPVNLVAKAGLNTGFALVHANATAIISEMRVLATPVSVSSIPAKGNQEDHNSMAMGSIRKMMQIIEHAQHVLAIELLLAAQAIDLIAGKMEGLPMGKGTSALHHWIRQSIDPMWEDRFILSDLEKMINFIKSDQILSQYPRI